VIDDNPQKLDLDLLAKTKDAFLPNWEIEVWNPTRGDDAKAVLKGLCSYGTLRDHGSTDIGREIRTGLLGGSELTWTGQGKTLSQVLSGTRFILVDLLFKGVDCGDTGEGDFQGVALIRGLARWMRDNLGGALPDVLALSRTDDPGIIQAAMRSGARDYVLKSRLLRLPGVLACLHPPQDESADALHRNFRQLYSLPNGTIGLLRNVCIPADRDKSRPPGPAAAEAAPSRAGSGPDAMGELLGAIPKTDLHVHAGTCMDPAFLVMASLVMLARHVGEAEFRKEVAAVASFLKRLRDGRPQRVCIPLESEHDLWVQVPKPARGAHAGSDFGRVADAFRRAVLCELRGHPSGAGGREKQRALRAFLHRVLEIRDHIDIREVRNGLARLGDTALAVSALGRAAYGAGRRTRTLRCLGADADDLMRIWILTTATESELTWRGRAATKVSGLLKSRGNGLLWKKLHDRLWASKEGLSPDALSWNCFCISYEGRVVIEFI
jgi:CheY-like chemotaxis protein